MLLLQAVSTDPCSHLFPYLQHNFHSSMVYILVLLVNECTQNKEETFMLLCTISRNRKVSSRFAVLLLQTYSVIIKHYRNFTLGLKPASVLELHAHNSAQRVFDTLFRKHRGGIAYTSAARRRMMMVVPTTRLGPLSPAAAAVLCMCIRC